MGAAPLRRAAADRRPPPQAHRVRRGAGSGSSRILRSASRRCLEPGRPHPSPGAAGMRVDRHGHRGRAGLAPAARAVRSARSRGSLRQTLLRPKGGVFLGKMGHTRGTCRSGQGQGWAGKLASGFPRSADGTDALPILGHASPLFVSHARGGHADPPAPPRTPGSAPPPRRGGGGEVGRAAACRCRVRCLQWTQVAWGPSRCTGGVGARSCHQDVWSDPSDLGVGRKPGGHTGVCVRGRRLSPTQVERRRARLLPKEALLLRAFVVKMGV